MHPTTRLPGTAQIERDIGDRSGRTSGFAVCYADLDHFKEFNDRYSYNEGDRVILLLSRILRDVVQGMPRRAFVGHIGGDDFIFNAPLDNMRVICEEIIQIFDELIPYQYTEEDRRAGYFLGRDRRGNILWVPLMTLSIGVVTNQNRRFTHTARVSELATEMKSFARSCCETIYAVDRRSDSRELLLGSALDTPFGIDLPFEDERSLSQLQDALSRRSGAPSRRRRPRALLALHHGIPAGAQRRGGTGGGDGRPDRAALPGPVSDGTAHCRCPPLPHPWPQPLLRS